MSTEYTVGIRFTGNASSLNQAAATAAAGEREVGRAGEAAGAQAAAGFGKTRAGVESISVQLQRVRTEIVGFIGAASLVQIGRGTARMADEYANIGSQMRQATQNAVSFAAAQDVAYGISQRTASSLSGTADLVSKVTRTLNSMGESGAAAFGKAAALTESVQQAIALSHVSAEAGNAAVIQLTQGLASGVLRGDELNSVLEQTPRLAQAIADGMGVTIGQLRAMGAQGLITAEQVVQALTNQSQTLRTEFADLPLTIDRSWTMLTNAVERYVGQVDQGLSASTLFAKGIAEVAEHIGVLAGVVATLGGVLLLNLGARALTAVQTYATSLVGLVRTQVATAAAERAAATAAVEAAQAKAIETAAALEAVQALRAEQVAKLATAQADVVQAQRHLAAAQAAGILSFAVREQRVATDNLTAAKARQAAAISELAAISRMEAGVQASLTAAATAQIAAQTRLASVTSLASAAMSGLRTVGNSLLALFGGWPGVVLAAAAAVVYLATRQTEAEKAAGQLQATSKQLADAHGRVTQAAIDEAKEQLAGARAALAKKQAELEAARAAIQFSGNTEIAARVAARAAEDVALYTKAVSELDAAQRTAIAQSAFQANADHLAQMARSEAQGFDAMRAALKDQNAELEKQIATYGKGRAAQLEYAKSLAIATEAAKGDNNVTKARIASLEDLYAPLIANARQLDAMTAATKTHSASTKDATAATRAAADAARELAQANADIASSQAALDEQNTQLRDKLAGLSDQQIEYNAGVRQAVQDYQAWVRAGVPVDQAMQKLQSRYDTINDRLQLKNQLDADDLKNTPNKVAAYETQTSAAERYYQVIEQGAKTAADAIGNYFVRNVSSVKDLWRGLVDAAKSVVAQIISTWLQLRVLQPLLGSVFGGGGGGWIGMATSLYGAASGGAKGAGGVGTDTGAGGSVTASQDYANYIQNGVAAYKAYQWASTGGVWGSGGVGAGNVASVGVGADGKAVAFNPWATSTPAGYYGGTWGMGGYSAPVASYGGALVGAYYGAHQGDGGVGTAGSTVAYGALGAGIAGTAAGVAGGMSVGTAAAGAYGAIAGASWVPIVGWILAAAALVDHFSGGKVFGTKYRTDAAALNLNIGPEGSSADAQVHQWKYRGGFASAMGHWGINLPSDWGDKDKRFKDAPVTPEMLAAAQQLYDGIEKTMVTGAQKLAIDVPSMIEATLSTQSTYDKKGKLKSTDYVVEYLGRTWKEATADAAAQRLGAEALVKVVEASAGSVAQRIAEQFRDSAETLLDGANTMLAAQADINKGASLVALGATATLPQVIKFVQGLQADGEALADTYARLMQASASYLQFVGQFAPANNTFGGSLQAIATQMQANIDQANALAQAAGLQHAREADLANIHRYAAEQAAAAIAQLNSSAQDLAAKLYAVTGSSLDAVNALLDKMSSKVQTATQLAIGDKSPLNDKQKLDVALQGLRSGLTSADDVLALGRRLYSSSADYTGLYNKVQDILGLPGAGDTGIGGITDAIKKYNGLIGQRNQYQAQADAMARFNDAKTLAQYVADISTTHGIGYGDAASGLGFSLQDLAKDLGITNITGYLDSLKLADIPGSTMDASVSIVTAIQQLGRDLIQAITGGPLANPGPVKPSTPAETDPQVKAILQQLLEQLSGTRANTEAIAKTNATMVKQGTTAELNAIVASSRGKS